MGVAKMKIIPDNSPVSWWSSIISSLENKEYPFGSLLNELEKLHNKSRYQFKTSQSQNASKQK